MSKGSSQFSSKLLLASLLIGGVLGLALYFQRPPKTGKQEIQKPVSQAVNLVYLNDQILGSSIEGSEIEVGGLSGLAWYEKTEALYAVSDDRGRQGPSRFYELAFEKLEPKNVRVKLVNEYLLRQSDGKPFPKRSFDTEGIAVNEEGEVFISSEGDFKETPTAVPGILKATKEGLVKVFSKMGPPVFPKDEVWTEETYGIRYNLSLESLDYHKESSTLVTATENALVQDDSLAGAKKGAFTRFYLFEVGNKFPGKLLSQKVYPISKIPSLDAQEGKSIIGVTDIVTLAAERYLVLERSYLGGRKKNRVQLFLADCREGTDVKDWDSLQDKDFSACGKELVFDFDELLGQLSDQHPRVDNLEGMELGPALPDGSRLLILVSDNNFSDNQATQFLFFKFSSNL